MATDGYKLDDEFKADLLESIERKIDFEIERRIEQMQMDGEKLIDVFFNADDPRFFLTSGLFVVERGKQPELTAVINDPDSGRTLVTRDIIQEIASELETGEEWALEMATGAIGALERALERLRGLVNDRLTGAT